MSEHALIKWDRKRLCLKNDPKHLIFPLAPTSRCTGSTSKVALFRVCQMLRSECLIALVQAQNGIGHGGKGAIVDDHIVGNR